ncbi:MAG: AEC family transporter [Zestosphaera sp.]
MITEVVVTMFGITALGMLINRLAGRTPLYSSAVELLVDFVYWILIPLTFFKTFSERGLELSDVWILTSFLVFMVITFTALYRARRYEERGVREAVFLSSAFPNAVFLGFPVSMAFFNTLEVASVFGLFTVTLNVVIPDLMTARRNAVVKLLRHPALIGFIAGVLLHSTSPEYVTAVSECLSWVTPLLSYSSTLVLGLRLPLSLNPVKKYLRVTAVVALFRFAVHPLVSLLVMQLFNVPWVKGAQLMLLSAMPPALVNTIISERYDWKPELVSTTTVTLTMFSLIALTVLSCLVRG